MSEAHTELIEPLLKELHRRNATDVQITSGSPPMLRIDGHLEPSEMDKPLTGEDTSRLVRSVLGPELVDRYDANLEVDFAFPWGTYGRFRGNAFHQRGDAAMALRLIPFEIPTFEQLGLPPVVSELAQLPQGFVLVTGPTGSGKSTTLASLVDWINTHRAVHIVTIEDPIEYVHTNKRSIINQREVGNDTHSFANALRSAFREDPDVLLVGEMRDNETISAALTLAETGHLVFATLHTNDAAQTLDRIVDVFPAEQQAQIRLQASSTLQAVVAQRLIPRVGGGRVAAFEVLIANYAARNIVRDGRTTQLRNVIATGTKDGMMTLEQSLTGLVADGLVAHEEAVTHTLHPNEVFHQRQM